MRGLGKLLAFLNPLDQQAASQIWKANAGKGMLGQALAVGGAATKQVMGGGYFQGRTLFSTARGLRSRISMGKFGTPVIRKQMARELGGQRKMVAGGLAAWAGLNMMAPDSSLTKASNTIGIAGGAILAGRGIVKPRWGAKAAGAVYGGAGLYAGAKMLGVM